MSKIMKTQKNRTAHAVIRVLGCRVSQAEMSATARELEQKGYVVSDDAENPDVVIAGTCCVTQSAEGKSRRMVKRLAEQYPRSRLIVTGCLGEINPGSLSDFSENVVVLGKDDKETLIDFVPDVRSSMESVASDEPPACRSQTDIGTSGFSERSRALLKVQDGCSQVCSYCIVPRARGRSRSVPLETALAQARDLEASGYREIVLTGIHLGDYGKDLEAPTDVASLTKRLLKACPLTRFRLSSIEPQEITPRLIELVAAHPRVCRHFHIPLQSGDDEILRAMRRPYSRRDIEALLESILRQAPDACVGMDVMVGFPGENEEAYERTRRLLEDSCVSYLHVFPFSPRPGTRAASFTPRVDAATANRRVKELRVLSEQLRSAFYERSLGKVFTAVVESGAKPDTDFVTARTDTYIPVQVPARDVEPGTAVIRVRLERLEKDAVPGSVVSGEDSIVKD